ncbi:hypothetical protein APHAL10511_007868 [Amanita phalloides]|nr:hypothetical protein APHAL10511_007868 [Amanita phalloides]
MVYPYNSPLSAIPTRLSTPPPPSENFYLDIYGISRKPKSFKQWVEAAQLRTKDLQEHGSTSPLVWVLVHGKQIPPNAIVAGEERRQPLYIARTFYEGGICIGKAGFHLEQGASFAYNGREIHVETYEVLVPALQPTRYRICDADRIAHIPRMHRNAPVIINTPITSASPLPPMRYPGIERLDKIKTVILVDDSSSMYDKLWPMARNALSGIVDLNAKYSAEGVDIYFLNSPEVGINMKAGDAVQRLFDSVIPQDETPTGQRLYHLFDKYLPLIENKFSEHRPITLIVITDGEPTDDPKEVIIEAARRLDQKQARHGCIGVQFAQIGDDPDATEALRELDDDLSKIYGVRDMVDTTPYDPRDPSFTIDTLTKILLGSLSRALDLSGSAGGLRDDRHLQFPLLS